MSRGKGNKYIAFVLLFTLMFSFIPKPSYAADGLKVTTNHTKEELVNKIIGSGIKNISNIKLKGKPNQFGVFSGGKDIIGFDEGIILSTGDADDVIGPNDNKRITVINNGEGDNDLNRITSGTQDAAVLEFDFEAEDPEEEYISFQYVFSSDEYNEYVNSKYNDVFALFVNGNNAALIPNTDKAVSINDVNGGNPYGTNGSNSKYYRNNDPNDGGLSINTQMDGLTVVMSVSQPIDKGKSNHIKLAIADVRDGQYDSNVFIKTMSIKSGKAKPGKIGFDSSDRYDVTIKRTDGSDNEVGADWTAKDKNGNKLGSGIVTFGDEETDKKITVPNKTKTVELSNPFNGATIDPEKAIITITLNNAPVAKDDKVTVDEDKSLSINVLKNDYDDDKDEIKITFLTQPNHGKVSGSVHESVYKAVYYKDIIYVPDDNFNGVDHFEYEISDGNGGKDKGIVNILVDSVNDAPTASDDHVSTSVNTKVTRTITAKDIDEDELTYSIHKNPSNGSVTIDENTGKWTYTPNTGFSGTDSFKAKIDDGNKGIKIITIDLEVSKLIESKDVKPNIRKKKIKRKKSSLDKPKLNKVKNDLAVVIETDCVKIEENDIVAFTINYYNKSNVDAENVMINLNTPDGVKIYDEGNGTVSKDTIDWKLPKLPKNSEGELIVKFKIEPMNKEERILSFDANISNDNTINTMDDKSIMKLFTYSNEHEGLHKRYVRGYPDAEFKAKRNITRAEIAAIFARILDLKNPESNMNAYKDVELEHWASGYIKAVTDRNLLTGYENGEFRPNQYITRGELATVIAKYLGVAKNGVVPMNMHFSDIEKHWALGNVEEIYRFKIINGYEDGTFKPNQYITRAEAVVMINKILYRGPLMNVAPYFPDITEKHWAFGHIQEAGMTHKYTINKDGSEKGIKIK